MVSSESPSSCATAIAAVALSALCRPGIGSIEIGDLMRGVGLAIAERDLEAASRRRSD